MLSYDPSIYFWPPKIPLRAKNVVADSHSGSHRICALALQSPTLEWRLTRIRLLINHIVCLAPAQVRTPHATCVHNLGSLPSSRTRSLEQIGAFTTSHPSVLAPARPGQSRLSVAHPYLYSPPYCYKLGLPLVLFSFYSSCLLSTLRRQRIRETAQAAGKAIPRPSNRLSSPKRNRLRYFHFTLKVAVSPSLPLPLDALFFGGFFFFHLRDPHRLRTPARRQPPPLCIRA